MWRSLDHTLEWTVISMPRDDAPETLPEGVTINFDGQPAGVAEVFHPNDSIASVDVGTVLQLSTLAGLELLVRIDESATIADVRNCLHLALELSPRRRLLISDAERPLCEWARAMDYVGVPLHLKVCTTARVGFYIDEFNQLRDDIIGVAAIRTPCFAHDFQLASDGHSYACDSRGVIWRLSPAGTLGWRQPDGELGGTLFTSPVLAADDKLIFAPRYSDLPIKLVDGNRVIDVALPTLADPVWGARRFPGTSGTPFRAPGILDASGAAIFPPASYQSFIRVLPAGELILFGPTMHGLGVKYATAGVRLRDGKIFFMPCTGHQIAIIDPSIPYMRLLPFHVHPGTCDAYVADAAQDSAGNYHYAPGSVNRVATVSPEGDVSFSRHILGYMLRRTEGDQAYTAPGVALGDGHVYFAPSTAANILRIGPSGVVDFIQPPFTPPDIGTPFTFKYTSVGLSANGRAYFTCSNIRNVYFLEIWPDGGVKLIAAAMPPQAWTGHDYRTRGLQLREGRLLFYSARNCAVAIIEEDDRVQQEMP